MVRRLIELSVRNRAVVLLLGVEVIQAAIGLSQYHLGLPIGLVGLHLLGAALSIVIGMAMMMFGGSPTRVAAPPMLEANTSAIRNGVGLTPRRSQTSRVTGATSNKAGFMA